MYDAIELCVACMRSSGRLAVLSPLCYGSERQGVNVLVRQEHDGLIERWKRKAMDNILELHNKTPVWNDGESLVTCLFAVVCSVC